MKINQGYELTFLGKNQAKLEAEEEPTKELLFEKDLSKNSDSTENMIIQGDNLEALKILKKDYSNKIKMIYIDPPYNTGRKFTYNDNFRSKDKSLDKATKRHSNWLSFMYSRLKLAKDLLTDDGVIFISIDDNEQANLKIICDEIFGEENFIEQLIWKKKSTAPNDRAVGKVHEYILAYSKDNNSLLLNLQKRDAKMDKRYSNPDNDPKGAWTKSDFSANGKGGRLTKSCVYPIINPKSGKEFYPPKNKCWITNEAEMLEMLKIGKIAFRESTGTPYLKRYLSEVRQGKTLSTLIFEDNDVLSNSGFSSDSAKEIRSIFEDDIFEFSKPSKLIRQLLTCGTTKDSLILDFFAGSGTTGDAVMQQNAEDGGNRKFILVQLDEQIDEVKSKPVYEFCKENNFEPVISSLTIERVNRAGDKIKENKESLDIGYRVFSLK